MAATFSGSQLFRRRWHRLNAACAAMMMLAQLLALWTPRWRLQNQSCPGMKPMPAVVLLTPAATTRPTKMSPAAAASGEGERQSVSMRRTSLVSATRRTAAVVAAAGLMPLGVGPSPAAAESPRENEFSLELSPKWKVKKAVQQAIRVRREMLFEATEPSIGGLATLTRTPLGAGRDQAERQEQIFGLVDAFSPQGKSTLSTDDIVKILIPSFEKAENRRERQWVDVRRLPGTEEYLGPGGQRYLMFRYESKDCTGKLITYQRDDGVELEDCDGKVLPWRRHYVTATAMLTKFTSMRSSYLDGVPEGKLSRLFEALWLWDVSAPAKTVDARSLDPELAKAARSFAVQPVELAAPEQF